MVLFVNACIRKESRTKILADRILLKLNEPVTEVKVFELDFPARNEEFLDHWYSLIDNKAFDDPLFEQARLFAGADKIVIAAPYWDLSFPAALKQYLENISALEITFKYTDDGLPVSLCKAEKLYYVTTAGGEYCPMEYGYGYVETLARSFYGIKDVQLFKVTGLDIVGADTEKLMNKGLEEIERSI